MGSPGALILPVGKNVFVAGLYNSAVLRNAVPEEPPTTKTRHPPAGLRYGPFGHSHLLRRVEQTRHGIIDLSGG